MSDATAEPQVSLTDSAVEKLSDIIEHHANPVAGLRLQISGRKDGRFQHLLSLVEDGAEQEQGGGSRQPLDGNAAVLGRAGKPRLPRETGDVGHGTRPDPMRGVVGA